MIRPWDSFHLAEVGVEKVIARRATMEVRAGMTANLGFGISAMVPRILLEEGQAEAVTWAIEQGAVGGMPLTGFAFGCAANADAYVPSPQQFIYFQGAGFDVAFGNPLHKETQVGAIVTPKHGARIAAHVAAAVQAGAQVCLGGSPLTVPGLAGQFYQPTVIRGVTPDRAIARDEVFGPVLSVMTFRTLDEAIRLTNDSTYGLSAGVWSENVHTCLTFARRAQAGTVWTNSVLDGFAEQAFGGMKQSGQGREIGQYGFDEFLEVKSLVMWIGRSRAPWVKPATGGQG